MAQRTDTFVAQEWTYLDMTEKNSNFFGANPIKITSLSGFGPQQVAIVKFAISDDVKKRKLKKITLEMPYSVVLFYQSQGAGFGSTSYSISAPGEHSDGSTPNIIDLKTITWNDYKDNYYSLLGGIGSQGAALPSIFLNEHIDGKSGTLKEVIWSDTQWSPDDVYYKSIYSLFKFDAILVNTTSSVTNITPSGMKLIIETDDATGDYPVTLKSPSNNAFLRRDKDNTFTWELGQIDYVFNPITQKKANLQWKINSSESWESVLVEGPETNCNIPANTFPSDVIKWKVTVTSIAESVSTSDERQFKTKDSISSAKIVSPKSIIIDNNKDNTFTWEHIIATNTEQTKAELEYSDAEIVDWNALKTVQGSTKSTIIAANTLPVGNLIWRVRTYNMDNAPGNWSTQAEFVSRGSSPAPSQITANTSPRVEVEWQSNDQISAEIKIGDMVYPIYGNAKKFKSPIFLPDGEIKISVRILNEFDLWSEWGTTTTIIENKTTEKLSINAFIKNYGVVLNWNLIGNMAYIYRDNQLIGKTKSTSYVDFESVGEHKYSVLVDNLQGNYSKSDEIKVVLNVPFALLKSRNSENWIVLKKRRGNYPSHKITDSMKTTYQFYAGRKLPVAYSPENLTRSHTFEFSTKSRKLAENIATLAGEEVIYKDCRGDIAIGIIDKITQTTDIATDINFKITEISDEVIYYD